MANRPIRVTAAALLALTLAALRAWGVHAAQVESVTVAADGNTFHITLDAVVNAPQPRVYRVLSDYARLGRMNPGIRSIGVRPAPGGAGERVRSVLDACAWFFCRQIVQVEDVAEPDPYTIAARIVPGEGDFRSGSCFWRVTADGAHTRLHYEATRVIGFWTPPIIGPWVIAHALRAQLSSSIAVLERLANQPESPRPKADHNS